MRLSVLAILCTACLVVCSPIAQANFIMDFTSLPSAQGWTYEALGNSVPESSVYSVNNGILTQNSLGVGYAQAPGANRYAFQNAFGSLGNPTLPFTISLRARVLEDEGVLGWAPRGFVFGAYTGQEGYGIGLGPSRITGIFDDQEFSTSINNTVFHDYRLEVTPGVSYSLFVDNTLLGTGLPYTGLALNYLVLGDATGGRNAWAEVSSYSFTQTVIPEPGTLLSAALGLAVLAGYAGWRRKQAPH